MIFELVKDFAAVLEAMPAEHPRWRVLKLFDEAIRRDVQFIDRHPTTLFQCMWNTCWWYDCPEAARHYVEPEGGWKQPLPWERDDHKLHQVLESWSRARQQARAAPPWLCSLRPPKVPLGPRTHVIGTTASVAAFISGTDFLVAAKLGEEHVHVWDLRTGQRVASLISHAGPFEAIGVSANGQRLVTRHSNNMLQIWNLIGFYVEMAAESDHAWELIAFSQNGRKLRTATRTGIVREWDIGGSRETETVPLKIDADNVWAVALSNDGMLFATGDRSGRVCVYDTVRRKRLSAARPLRGPVKCLAFHPNARSIAVGGDMRDSRIAILDLHHPTSGFRPYVPCPRYMTEYGDMVVSLSYSPDGQWIAAAGGAEWGYHNDNSIRVWNASTLKEVIRIDGHSYQVAHVAFSGDSNRLLSIGTESDATIRVWLPFKSPSSLQPVLHAMPISQITVSPSGQSVATNATRDEALFIWDAERLSLIGRAQGHTSIIQSFSFSPDGNLICTGSGGSGHGRLGDDYTVRFWSIEHNRLRANGTFHHHSDMVTCVGFLDNETAYSAALDCKLVIYHLGDKTHERTILLRDHWIRLARLSPDGRFLLTTSGSALKDHNVTLWEWRGAQVVHRFGRLSDPPVDIAFGREGDIVLVKLGYGDRAVGFRAWDRYTGEEIEGYPIEETPWVQQRPLSGVTSLKSADGWALTSSHDESESTMRLNETLAGWWPSLLWNMVHDARKRNWLAADGNYLAAFRVE